MSLKFKPEDFVGLLNYPATSDPLGNCAKLAQVKFDTWIKENTQGYRRYKPGDHPDWPTVKRIWDWLGDTIETLEQSDND